MRTPEMVVLEKKSLTIPDTFRKIIVTGDIVKCHTDENGMIIMNIYDFLLNADSLDW